MIARNRRCVTVARVVSAENGPQRATAERDTTAPFSYDDYGHLALDGESAAADTAAYLLRSFTGNQFMRRSNNMYARDFVEYHTTQPTNAASPTIQKTHSTAMVPDPAT